MSEETIDVYSLDDEELMHQLKKHNYPYGPIIDSTRKVYQKKLHSILNEAPSFQSTNNSMQENSIQENTTSLLEESDLGPATTDMTFNMSPIYPVQPKPHFVESLPESLATPEQQAIPIRPERRATPFRIDKYNQVLTRRPLHSPEFLHDYLPKESGNASPTLLQRAKTTEMEPTSKASSSKKWILIALVAVMLIIALIYNNMEDNKPNPFNTIEGN